MPLHMGVLSFAFLLASPFAYAQQQPPQNTPCFEIYRNPSAGAAGALLLNTCTGQTWILIGTGPARWYPLSTTREEYNPPPQR